MLETFRRAWSGSSASLERDGFGREFEVMVAAWSDALVGFAAWSRTYDLHHCVAGATILDLYVIPAERCRGVAVRLACAVAGEASRRGGSFLKGQAVENPSVHRLYGRVAMCFPGADCIVGGRAFRALSALEGKSTRDLIRRMPQKAWNFEP